MNSQTWWLSKKIYLQRTKFRRSVQNTRSNVNLDRNRVILLSTISCTWMNDKTSRYVIPRILIVGIWRNLSKPVQCMWQIIPPLIVPLPSISKWYWPSGHIVTSRTCLPHACNVVWRSFLGEGMRERPYVIYIVVVRVTKTSVSFWLTHPFLTRTPGSERS